MTQKQPTCCHCFTTLGTMPNGEEHQYVTIVFDSPYLEVVHRCADAAACKERRRAAQAANLQPR